MSRNIVICCDGTGNSFENIETESNVSKLYSCIRVNEGQIGYYHPGVGTMGAPNSRGRLGREWSRIKGLAFGAGLLANVGDAYRYLMDTYADGDHIFLFGFSRGAFTARALGSLLHVFGLLCAGNHELIPYILQMYARRSRQARHRTSTFEPDEAFQWQFSHKEEVRISFCGLVATRSVLMAGYTIPSNCRSSAPIQSSMSAVTRSQFTSVAVSIRTIYGANAPARTSGRSGSPAFIRMWAAVMKRRIAAFQKDHT